ncbi:hypothetical protein CPS_1644 [Colwellia psychrerythraea 34H]|uniref:Uncharacterized protein n=1 Tax=Colwellia psychrerythraea (strain 34H / ATCC BAA-681) TaxID=167879 RepID=Q484Y3_COLP3|nr:hypothetical protein CPS_1644 [Colwellia psychrerythraea 34H]
MAKSFRLMSGMRTKKKLTPNHFMICLNHFLRLTNTTKADIMRELELMRLD